MRLMPALVEEDFASFSGAIGDPARGWRLLRGRPGRTVHQPGAAQAWAGSTKGIAGVGQTSWGPTGRYRRLGGAREALLREARERFAPQRAHVHGGGRATAGIAWKS
jgi:predicted sugar kinase